MSKVDKIIQAYWQGKISGQELVDAIKRTEFTHTNHRGALKKSLESNPRKPDLEEIIKSANVLGDLLEKHKRLKSGEYR